MHLPPSYTKEVKLFAYKQALNADVIARISNNPGVEKWNVDEWMMNTQMIEGNREFNMTRGTTYLPRYSGQGQARFHAPAEDMMDVDVNKQEIGKRETRKCYNCGKTGHLKKNCFKKRKTFGNNNGNNFKKKPFVKRNELDVQSEDDETDVEGQSF